MKKLLLLALSFSFIYAYSINDKVPQQVLKDLGVTKKVAIIDFFASWCISCEHELPVINEISKKYDNVDFIGIDVDENKEDGVAFQKSLNLGFKIINDNKQEIIKKFEPVGVPAIYILKDGEIKQIHIGAIDNIDKVITKDIAELQ